MIIRKASNEQRRIEALLRKQDRRMRRAFLDFVRDVRSPAVMREIMRFLEAGDIRGAMGVINTHIAAMAATAPAIIAEVARAEVAALQGQFRRYQPSIALSFDPGDPEAASIIRNSRLSLIQGISSEQERVIRQVLTDATQRGLGSRAVAREIRQTIGLTAGQEQWVARYRQSLEILDRNALGRDLRDRRFDKTVARAIDRGEPLSREQIDRMVGRYRERALAYRTETIARTESTRALNQARENALDQVLRQTGTSADRVVQIWRTNMDGRQRDTHAGMNGQERQRGQAFDSPSGAQLRFPGDPRAPAGEVINCRCNVEMRILPPEEV